MEPEFDALFACSTSARLSAVRLSIHVCLSRWNRMSMRTRPRAGCRAVVFNDNAWRTQIAGCDTQPPLQAGHRAQSFPPNTPSLSPVPFLSLAGPGGVSVVCIGDLQPITACRASWESCARRTMSSIINTVRSSASRADEAVDVGF